MKSGSATEFGQAIAAFDSPLERQLVLDRLSAALLASGHEPGVAPTIGRFSILRKLGHGGMGIVYLGYDEQLGRQLAVKLVRGGSQHSIAHQRMLREARALARLCHPNVVQIYETGVHHADMFIAMEFVAGDTLDDWLAQAPRSVAEILAVFMEAGRGLAAAHAAGLVHRDFKPSNVMITRDGHAKVTDFGLVRPTELDDTESDVRDVDRGEVERPDAALTETGVLMGTPAYMAPEQLRRLAGDTRSDQFSFCVALWESLYGERPFSGATLEALEAEVLAGRIREPPRAKAVPNHIRATLERGLASEPSLRWPTMDELLTALARDPSKQRRRVVTAAVVLALVAGLGWMAGTREAEKGVCARLDADLAGVWDARRRAEVQAAIEATGKSYATDTWTRVEAVLDDYAQAWVAARTRACEATQRGTQSDELLDRRMACLDERLDEFDAIVGSLAQIDASWLDQAVISAQSLPSLERCADFEALAARVPLPDNVVLAAEVEMLDAKLGEAKRLAEARRHREALATIESLLREPALVDYPPLDARVWLQQGKVQEMLLDYPAAEQSYLRAYERSLGLGMLEEAALASERLIYVVGYRLSRFAEGRNWAIHAEALATAASISHSDLVNTLGVLAFAEGRSDEALELFERSLSMRVAELGEEHPFVARSHGNIGAVFEREGDKVHALEHYARAEQILERALGPEHPHLAVPLTAQARIALAEAEFARAQALATRASAIVLAGLGPEHPERGYSLSVLGVALLEQGQADRAAIELERALQLHAQRGAAPMEIAEVEFDLARALWETGEQGRALELAASARDNASAAGQDASQMRQDIERWLESHTL